MATIADLNAALASLETKRVAAAVAAKMLADFRASQASDALSAAVASVQAIESELDVLIASLSVGACPHARPVKVYLAGPMRGIPEFNFPAFRAAAADLRWAGYEVFSPAERDEEKHGILFSVGNVRGDEGVAAAEHGFNLREALGADLAWLCAEADAIALLPGWRGSKGARAEFAVAAALGLKFIYLEQT